MKKHLIYCHDDPKTGIPRYVGRSSSGLNRARSHFLRPSLKGKSPHQCWIRKILLEGLEPVVRVLQDLDDTPDVSTKLNEAERFWISKYKSENFPLLNVTEGGDDLPDTRGVKNAMFGLRGPLHPSYGKKRSREFCEQNSRLRKGIPKTEAMKEKVRIARARQVVRHSEETKEKIRQARLKWWADRKSK